MSIVKFKAVPGWGKNITRVEVEKETDSSVWINGRRQAKRSRYDTYFSTWKEAHNFLAEDAEAQLRRAQSTLDQARSRLEAIKRLKPHGQDAQ